MYQGGKDFFIALGEVYGPDRGAWLPWGVELFPLTGNQIEANVELSQHTLIEKSCPNFILWSLKRGQLFANVLSNRHEYRL